MLAVAAGLFIAYEALTWPDVASLATSNPPTTAFMERYRSRRIGAGTTPELSWKWVSYDRISPHLKRAVLVAEDINFFSHNGFATDELRNAVRDAIAERSAPRGASTISQQLVKNLWLSPSRNPVRKLKEAVLTAQLERSVNKRRILEVYLNVVEFGPGVYGAEAASRMYFGEPASELSERQAAQLAAGLPSPARWNPSSSSRVSQRRVELILRRMARAKFLWKVI